MKRFLLSMMIVFVATVIGCSQTDTSTTDDSKKPEIEFEELIHDYGVIEKGGNGTCEFIFKNTGKDPLILSNVKASCGCTVPTYSKEPIKKGKTGVITVKYNTNIVGSFTKSITVSSNASNPTVVLKIKGKVVAAQQ